MAAETDQGANESKTPFQEARDAAREAAGNSLRQELETTSLYGTVCRKQPGENELPVLEAGKFSTGCDYKKFEASSTTRANYDSASKSAAHIYSRSGEWVSAMAIGSGFAVAKSADTCYVVTDNHVVAESEDDFQVKMTDGRLHDGKVQSRKLESDLALLAVSTGGDTDNVCHPVKVIDEKDEAVFAKKGDTLTVLGYPAHTKSLYVSNGDVQGVVPRADYRDGDGKEMKTLPGEDSNRKVILLDARVEGGNSGSSVYNSKQEVGAVLDAGDSDSMRNAMLTPINKAVVDEMLKGVELKQN